MKTSTIECWCDPSDEGFEDSPPGYMRSLDSYLRLTRLIPESSIAARTSARCIVCSDSSRAKVSGHPRGDDASSPPRITFASRSPLTLHVQNSNLYISANIYARPTVFGLIYSNQSARKFDAETSALDPIASEFELHQAKFDSPGPKCRPIVNSTHCRQILMILIARTLLNHSLRSIRA